MVKIIIRSLSHCQNVHFNYKSWMDNKYVYVALGPYSAAYPCTETSFGYSTSFRQEANFRAKRKSWLQGEALCLNEMWLDRVEEKHQGTTRVSPTCSRRLQKKALGFLLLYTVLGARCHHSTEEHGEKPLLFGLTQALHKFWTMLREPPPLKLRLVALSQS